MFSPHRTAENLETKPCAMERLLPKEAASYSPATLHYWVTAKTPGLVAVPPGTVT